MAMPLPNATISTDGINAVCVIGGKRRVQLVSTSFNAIPVAKLEVESLDDHDNRQRANRHMRGFYGVGGIIGKYIRAPLNRLRDATSGRVVVVCDDVLSPSGFQFFSELIPQFHAIPTMFVQLVPGEREVDKKRALDAGFDLSLDYVRLGELAELSRRHFAVIKRNRLTIATVFVGLIYGTFATLTISAVASLGSSLSDGAIRLISDVSQKQERGVEVVSYPTSNGDWTEMALLVHGSTANDMFEIDRELSGIEISGLPLHSFADAGTTRVHFYVRHLDDDSELASRLIITFSDGTTLESLIPHE